MTIDRIIHDAGMSTRPEFYSGRGATCSDLNNTILTKIHVGIVCEFGASAGANFVNMVAALPKLSATDFLLALSMLAGRDFKWNNDLLPNTGGIYAGGLVDGATVIDVMFGNNDRDETAYIRGQFLRANGGVVKNDSPNCWYR